MTGDDNEFSDASSAIGEDRYHGSYARGFCHLAFQVAFPTFSFTDDQAEEITSLDRRGDLGADGIFIVDEDQQILLFQSKSSASLDDQDLEREIGKFTRVPLKLLDDEWTQRAHAELRGLANEFRSALRKDYQILYAFAAGSPIPDRVRSLFEGLSSIPDLPSAASIELLDGSTLESRYRKLLLGEHGRFTDVEFMVRPSQIHSPPSAESVAYLTIPAEQYVRECKQYGMELFRYNPRLFLGTNKVNSGIEHTLKQEPERTWFHLLNNGITAVCRRLEIEDLPGDGKRVAVEDFQVVNGCQTTMTLFLNSANVEGNEKVLIDLKIIQSPGLRELISKTTNTQTAILAEDTFANELEQRRIHDLLKRFNPPYFYAPKRGAWEQVKAVEKRRYQEAQPVFGRYRKVTSKELAAVCLAIFGEPESAKDKPRVVFEKSAGKNSPLYECIFQVQNVAAQWLLPWEVFRYANALVQKEAQADSESERARIGAYGRYRMVYLAYDYLADISGDPVVPEAMEFLTRPTSERLLRRIDKWAPRLLEVTLDALVDAFNDAQARDDTTGLREFFREKKHQPVVKDRFRKALQQKCPSG